MSISSNRNFSNKTTGLTAIPDKDLLVNQDINNVEFIYYEAFKINDTYLHPIEDSNNQINKYGEFGQSIPASYYENRVAPIITRASEYKVAVGNFSLHASTIPMFKIRNEYESPFVSDYYPYRYTIHYKISGIFPPGGSSIIPTPWEIDTGYDHISTPTLPYSQSQYLFPTVKDSDNIFIYTYDHVVTEINRILQSLFTNMVDNYNSYIPVILPPSYPTAGILPYSSNIYLPQYAPYVTFDSATDLFTFHADYRMTEANFGAPNGFVEVTFSNNLYQLFRGNSFFFDVTTPRSGNLSRYRRLVFEQGVGNINAESVNVTPFTIPPTTPVNMQPFIKNVQQFSSSSSWYTYNKLFLVSNTIGERPTSLGIDKPIIPSNGLNNTSNILATYNIVLDNTDVNNINTSLIYNPAFPLWIDMYRDNALYNVDLLWYIGDDEGNLIPLNLSSGESFSVKLIFARKFF